MPSEQEGVNDDISCWNRLNHGKLCIERNGYFKSKSYVLSIDGSDLLKAASSSMLHTGTFYVDTTDLEALSTSFAKPTLCDKIWDYIGNVESPGILFDRSIVKDCYKKTKAAIIYNNTSRTGDLMSMEVIIPKINHLSEKHLINIISSSSILPKDCSQIIAEYLPLSWTENISEDVTPSNCHTLIDGNKITDNKLMILRNKLPSWNSQINAYTLEFGGRALVPSVHNFQLVDCTNNVVLQLGKINDAEFNVDFAFPLSPYQAFSICLSVIDRTFVWD